MTRKKSVIPGPSLSVILNECEESFSSSSPPLTKGATGDLNCALLQIAADHQALDFRRAFHDLKNLAILIVARHGIFVHEAVPSVYLEGVAGALLTHFRGKELCVGGLQRMRHLIVLQPGRLKVHVPGKLDVHGHVGDLEGNALETEYGFAELDPLLRILERCLVAGPCQSHAHGRNGDTPRFEDGQVLGETLALLPEKYRAGCGSPRKCTRESPSASTPSCRISCRA